MPIPALQLDYANILDSAIGPAHGLSLAEIKRSEAAARDVVARIERERKAGQHRYRELPHDTEMLKQVRAAVRRYAGKFENLVVLGIGGSALGNTALQTALNPPLHNLLAARARRGPRLFVMDNVDPVQFGSLLDVIGPELRKTLFNVISKSGETAETASQFVIVRDLVARKLGRRGLKTNIVVTTDPAGGTMRGIVDAEGYDALPVPPGVGGRFSVLSAVGLFSAGMCGIKIDRLLAGAAAMGARVGQSAARKNPAGMLAMLLHAFYVRGKRLHVMMPYSYQLKDLADWYRQMWAESLGKQQDLEGQPVVVGPTPIKARARRISIRRYNSTAKGERQGVHLPGGGQVHAGREDPACGGVARGPRYLQGSTLGTLLNAEKRATEFARVASRRPCLTIRFPVVSEETVGQFIMLWEAATSIAGGLLNINPYDQPAVQTGKEFTFALMGKRGYEKQAAEYKRFAKRGGKYLV